MTKLVPFETVEVNLYYRANEAAPHYISYRDLERIDQYVVACHIYGLRGGGGWVHDMWVGFNTATVEFIRWTVQPEQQESNYYNRHRQWSPRDEMEKE